MTSILLTILMLLVTLPSAVAGEADVLAVGVNKQADGTYQFDVTISHRDEGWEHYADKWEILGPDGSNYGTRVLYHPHVDEQPFTRSLSGVKIPAGVTRVTLRAHDSVHEYGGEVVVIDLP